MAGTVTCGSCGKTVAAGDRFCAGCGAPVTVAEGTASGPGAVTVVSRASLRSKQASRLIEATEGEFEILEELGSGAMGAVYLGMDIALSRKVAIKVIAPHLLSDESMISRFRLEAQTVASLRHPNIVNVHAVRQADELHYFVMEFIDGPPLRDIVKRSAPLDIDVAQSILFQVGSALSHAHRSRGGVIHRDVKPANIMVDREGDAFVTDFGISKIAEAQSGLTQTGATIGTPEYMSPEQCRGETLTGASDQYALGVVAYEMLCGHTPFGGSQYHIMVAHTTEPPKAIREIRPDCPPHVAEAVERMLAKTPDDRWPDLDSAVSAMGGAPLGYHDPVRQKIKALTGATLMDVRAVGTASPSGGASGGRAMVEAATSVSVLGLPSVLETGERIQLRADVRGSGNTSLDGRGVTWASTDPSIAKVEGGWVEGMRPGSVSIMASAGNVASSVVLTVAEPAPAKVLVRPASVRMHRGGTIGLRADVQDRRGRPLEGQILWRSSDPSVATVSPTGEVVASGSGPVTITARTGGASGTAEIVVEAPSAALAPAARAAEPKPAEAKPATPGPRPHRGPRPAPGRRPAAASGAAARRPAHRHPAVVAAALIALVGAGVVGIQSGGGGEGIDPPPADDGGAGGRGGEAPPTGTAAVTPGPATSGSATAGAASSGAGGAPPAAGESASGGRGPSPSALAQPSGSPPSGNPAPGAGSTQPMAPPQAAGRGRRPLPRARVADTPAATPPTAPARVQVAVERASMPAGGSQPARARVFAPGGLPLERSAYSLTWRSSDGSVASVDPQSGVLRATGPGTAWIVAAAGGASDSVLVTVAAPASAVRISQQDFSVEAGAPPRALQARVLDPGGAPVDRSVTWSSSNSAVATVDAAGRVTPLAAGSARITASADGLSDQVTVSVTDPAPALPTTAEARAAVEAYVAALVRRNRDLVARLWGAGDAGRRNEVLDLMGQSNLDVAVGAVSPPTQVGGAAMVTFRVRATWRTSFGQNRNRDLTFRGRLERVGSEWQLVSSALQ